MKKVISLLLAFVLIMGTLPIMAKVEREVWVPSPGITCGITSDEVLFNKAVHSGCARLYKLEEIGDRYYIGAMEEQMTDGGSNGKQKTAILYYYTLLETDDSFIILGKARANNEYYWNNFEGVTNISQYIDTKYYTDLGYEAPVYMITPKGKYTYSRWDEYTDYFFVGNNGGIARLSDWMDYGQQRVPMIFENKLITCQYAYYSSERSYKFYLSDGITEAAQRCIIGIKNGGLVNVSALSSVARTTITSANGYRAYSEGYSGNTPRETYYMFNDDSERFFKYHYSYSSTHKAYLYDVKICKKENGVMNVVSESSFSTGASTIPAYTPTTINGIDENAYTSIGMSTPLFKLGNGFILKNGKAVGFLPENIGTNYNWCIYNGRIAIIRNTVDSNYIYYKDENGIYYYWQRINYLNFSDSEVTLSEDIDLPVGAYTNLNGYYASYSSFVSYDMFVGVGEASLTQWWTHYLDNKFSDGRYVTAHWVGMGNSMYEIWYDIYNKDGQLISTGPSGFSTTASSSLSISELRAFAINDTKIILALATVSNSWFNEYYRSSVVTENDDGIVEVPQPLGKKNLVMPEDTDTEPINDVIDFSADELELGFNIKSNIIDTDKFTPEVREMVKTIHLNDLVIVAKEEAQQGNYRVGISLGNYNNYDYSFGDEPIYFYTNGATLNWRCSNPEKLEAGTYNQLYVINGMYIYVTVKVIEPPSNNSATTVMF